MTNHTGEPSASGMDSGSMGSSMQGMGGMLDCFGNPIPERQGNWQGHVFPGTIFIIWGTHWLISASWRHISAVRAGRQYRARSAEGLLPMVPALGGFNRYPVESALKAIGGLLLFVLQITYGGYKFLLCSEGVRQGRLVTQHLNSWAHATMNLGYSLSGFVELLGLRSRLPDNLNLAVLSSAFFIEGMLFSLHEKNGHLDQTIHWLLAQACFAGALFTGLEAAWPESFLLSAGRIGAIILQGTWFCQTARVLFDGLLEWNDSFDGAEDEAPAMFLPMIFVFHMLVLMALMVAVYSALEALHRRMVPEGSHANEDGPSQGVYETSRLLSEDDGGEAGGSAVKAVPLSTMSGLRRGV